MYKKLLFLSLVMSLFVSSYSQYSYTAGFPIVYNILNTKCQNAGCHSAASGDALRFDTTQAAVWTSIVSQTPANAAAQARGEQLVWIDQPYQSYLLKKAGSWFDTDLALPVGEPDSAAHAGAGLTNIEVEYIRQWIMDSAAQATLTIDTGIINDYYNDTARCPFFPKLAPPTGDGVQVRYGPLFLRNLPGANEVELLLMHKVLFPTDMEVTSMNVSMNSFSHHFILFTFDDSASAIAEQVGFREVQLSVSNTISPFDGNKNVASVWVYSQQLTLPAGTAFFWPQHSFFDLDYHVKNYSTYAVMPFDCYINLSGSPRNTSDNIIQMKAGLENNTLLGFIDQNPPHYPNFLPPHTTSMCIDEDAENGKDNMRYLWLLNSHTHKMGVGFNIFNYDPSKPNSLGDDTLYNGLYDYGTGQYTGVYDWEHPAIELFNPQKAINYSTSGLIAQTVYANDSSFYQTFGFTTANEMQLFYYLYTSELPGAAGINAVQAAGFDFSVYPNPMTDKGTIGYTLANAATVNVSITDITGKQVAALKNENEQAGTYHVDFGSKSLSPGMYFARVSVNGDEYTKKFIQQ
jgi:hypothetical protein